MRDKRQWIPVGGFLVVAAIAVYMVVQLNAQTAPVTGDFANAATAEVRDTSGQVVLRGQFVQVPEEDDDVERKATLQPTGVDADAAGEAEVEVTKATPSEQEIEFTIEKVRAGAVFTFVIDGREVASATADRHGKAEVELDVRPAASARR